MVVAVEYNSLAEAVRAVANNTIVVAAEEEEAAAVDILPSFQYLDHPMMMKQQVEAAEEPFLVEGGGSEHWYWLVP